MIEVIYNRELHSIMVKGHGGGEYGSDLVCAAASVLVYTLAENVNRLSSVEPDKYRCVKLCMNPGSAEIAVTTHPARDSVTNLVFDTVCVGFQLLQKNYPDKLRYRCVAL